MGSRVMRPRWRGLFRLFADGPGLLSAIPQATGICPISRFLTSSAWPRIQSGWICSRKPLTLGGPFTDFG